MDLHKTLHQLHARNLHNQPNCHNQQNSQKHKLPEQIPQLALIP